MTFLKVANKIILLCLLFSFISCKRYTTFSFPALGTVVAITLPSDNDVYKNYIISKEIVDNFQAVFNRYDEKSDLSFFNKNGGKFRTSKYICEVIEYSRQIYENTKVFNITVLPLLEIWDYKKGIIPSEIQIKKALRKVCFECIKINNISECIVEKKKDIRIDLGGIAKGYIIKKLYQELSKNYKEGVVNIGGDIFAFGREWDVYILDPKTKLPKYKIKVRDKAVFTSGDYERFFIKDGKLYSHIIDPRNGSPVLANYHSVTVVGTDPVISDGLATSFFILGPSNSFKVLSSYKDYSFMFIGNEIIKSPNFPKIEETK